MTNHGPQHFLSVVAHNEYQLERDKNGYTFADRDARWFSCLLQYLREGYVPGWRRVTTNQSILREAGFFGITGLCEVLCEQTLFVVICAQCGAMYT